MKPEGQSSSSSDSSIERTFIPLKNDSTGRNIDFINTKFVDDEEEDLVQIIDLQTEEKPPLFLLFPDLENEDKKHLTRTTSTTQVTRLLVGKQADFSLLKPSKKLNQLQKKLSPLTEVQNENKSEDDEIGN